MVKQISIFKKVKLLYTINKKYYILVFSHLYIEGKEAYYYEIMDQIYAISG